MKVVHTDPIHLEDIFNQTHTHVQVEWQMTDQVHVHSVSARYLDVSDSHCVDIVAVQFQQVKYISMFLRNLCNMMLGNSPICMHAYMCTHARAHTHTLSIHAS